MLFLVQNGVPWEVCGKWSDKRRLAACVALREMRGETFDWDAMMFIEVPDGAEF
ncbi:hypothetical protein [Acetobacter sp. A11-2]|uniref:hypothetical protein n=1 Tax=Acetobacter sp. A11-2 TaxID=3157859 RepID=UPI0032EE7C54